MQLYSYSSVVLFYDLSMLLSKRSRDDNHDSDFHVHSYVTPVLITMQSEAD